MKDTRVVGSDIAKRVFQIHAAGADGRAAFGETLSRGKLLGCLRQEPRCAVAMEARATAHQREIAALGHDVRAIPPVHAKPFVKRQT
ncbi:MAG: hypothetical protein AAF565_05215 [Pseudomonadota bacterium]